LIKLNPHARTHRRRELLAKEKREKKKQEVLDAKRKGLIKKDPKITASIATKEKRIKKEQEKFLSILKN